MAYVRMDEAHTVGRSAVPAQERVGNPGGAARAIEAALRYDIFPAHSFDDAEATYVVKRMIEALNLRVYVVWLDDPKLDRDRVAEKTAAELRERMRACSSLLSIHSMSSMNSVWRHWELGCFEGIRPRLVWLLSLVTNDDNEFRCHDFGLYPPVEKLSSLAGQIKLGFDCVGGGNRQVVPEGAVRGNGVFFASRN